MIKNNITKHLKQYIKYDNIISIFILIIMYFYIVCYRNRDLVYIKSTLNNKKYLCRNLADSHIAVNLLSEVDRRINGLKIYLTKTYKNKKLNHRIKRFHSEMITEASSDNKRTSYLINKKELVLCLRDKTTNELYNINTIMFVTLHEFGHLISKGIGHDAEFWSNFKFLLQNAIRISIYNPLDYSKHMVKYCSIIISSSPLYNDTIKATDWNIN